MSGSKYQNYWSEEEIGLLKDVYQVSTPEQLEQLFKGRNYKNICGKAAKLGLERRNCWTPAEIEKLKKWYSPTNQKEWQAFSGTALSESLGRPWSGIKQKATKLGLKRPALVDVLDIAYILNKAKEGTSACQISKELGLGHDMIGDILRSNGFDLCVSDYELPHDEIIYKYKNEKISAPKLAEMYGCKSEVPIRRILEMHDIEANTDRDYKNTLDDENFFETIDSEAKSYLLGLIAADGCLSTKRGYYLSLTLVDEDLLRRAAELIGWKGRIYVKKGQYKIIKGKKVWCRPAYRFMIGSKKLVMDIIRHGIGVNKSRKLKFPNIPENLQEHFIRGFFDGDGCATFSYDSKWWIKGRPHFSIIGLKQILLDIQRILIDNCGISKTKLVREKRVKKYEMYNLHYSGEFALFIRNYLYKNATICHARKYDKLFSVEMPVKEFSGYTATAYSEKYGFSLSDVRRWISNRVVKTKKEYGVNVISYDEGDKLAKYMDDTIPFNEAAEQLGVSRSWFWQLTHRGIIQIATASRLRNRIYKSEIERVLDTSCHIIHRTNLRKKLKHEVQGLYWDAIHQRWVAKIMLPDGRMGLGSSYLNKEDAVEIIKRATKLLEDGCQDRNVYKKLRRDYKQKLKFVKMKGAA